MRAGFTTSSAWGNSPNKFKASMPTGAMPSLKPWQRLLLSLLQVEIRWSNCKGMLQEICLGLLGQQGVAKMSEGCQGRREEVVIDYSGWGEWWQCFQENMATTGMTHTHRESAVHTDREQPTPGLGLTHTILRAYHLSETLWPHSLHSREKITSSLSEFFHTGIGIKKPVQEAGKLHSQFAIRYI